MMNFRRHIAPSLRQACYVLPLIFCSQISQAADISHKISLAAAYNDNVGLAPERRENVNEALVEFKASRRYSKRLSMSSSVFYGAQLSARHYTDIPLGKTTLGLNIAYEKKLGLGFDKPRMSFSWKLDREFYQRSNLDTYLSNLSVAIAKPLGQQIDSNIRLSLRTEFLDQKSIELSSLNLPTAERRYTDSLTTIDLQLSMEYFANSKWSFPVSLQLTDGEVASISSGAYPNVMPDWLNNAVVSNTNNSDTQIHRNNDLVRNSVDARGGLVKLAANRLLKDGSTLNLEVGLLKAESKQDIKYDRQQVSITWSKKW